ncbi:MAG: hypothetical protein RLY58_2299 [Pseudomonadota bacterium]|jgi:hypothetical protein
MHQLIYLDESGDLGWQLNLPYGAGGSSRFLVIAAVICDEAQLKHLERLVRNLYKTFQWNTKKEKKWVDMPDKARETFAKAVANLAKRHPDIQLLSIAVDKTSIPDFCWANSHLLYNYMMKCCLIQPMSHCKSVRLHPDRRSVKVESGTTCQDYLQLMLWYEAKVPTTLYIRALDSQGSLAIQFADMLAGVVGVHLEFGKSHFFNIVQQSPSFSFQIIGV